MNRITSADYTATGEAHNFSVFNILYDKNGNLTQLKRNYRDAWGHSQLMDNLSYSYDSGNKLQKVTDSAHSTHKANGFKDGTNSGNDYAYDSNGQLKIDQNKGINLIQYNHLGLPTRIAKIPNREEIVYVYDATGVKLEKQVVSNNARNITQYAENYVYSYFPKVGVTNLESFNHPEGYVTKDDTGFKYVYQYKDNMGNVRLSYVDNNGDGIITPSTEIIEESNYYPFGLKHKGYNNNVSSLGNSRAQKWAYQDQELLDDLDINVYEWKYRISDPSIGRFWQVDPLAEDYRYNSTYAFQENKLGIGVELEGLEVSKHEWLDKKKRNHITYNANIKVLNKSNASLEDIVALATSIASNIENKFKGKDSEGNIISTSVTLEYVDEVDTKEDFYMEFTNSVKKSDGKTAIANGKVDKIGDAMVNRMQIIIPGMSAPYGEPQTKEGAIDTGAHEYGHALGLRHQEKNTDKSLNGSKVGYNNLMRFTSRERKGKKVINGTQLSILNKTVRTTTNRMGQIKWNRKKAKDIKNQRAGKF